MHYLNKIVVVGIAALFGFSALADPANAAKKDLTAEVSTPIVKYEITFDRKQVKDAKSLIGKIEASEAFKVSECTIVKSNKKGVYVYACEKASCGSHELFNSLAQPGVKVYALTSSCPFGCKWATSCSGSGVPSCCKITSPGQKCPVPFGS